MRRATAGFRPRISPSQSWMRLKIQSSTESGSPSDTDGAGPRLSFRGVAQFGDVELPGGPGDPRKICSARHATAGQILRLSQKVPRLRFTDLDECPPKSGLPVVPFGHIQCFLYFATFTITKGLLSVLWTWQTKG